MSVLRFIGATSREAMRKVRDALGDDALIVANRRVDDGVEILAMADEVAPGAPPQGGSEAPPAGAGGGGGALQGSWAPTGRRRQTDASPEAGPATDASAGDPKQPADAADPGSRLLQEIQGMRTLLMREQAQRSGGSGSAGHLYRLLVGAGFSAALTEELLQALPQELERADAEPTSLHEWAVRQLSARLDTLSNEDDFFMQGGVMALVGPTGVGKTTSTAKIAARCVMTHGADQVALLSTDSFRIGAHEQLRIYAELLNVPLYALDAEQPVNEVLTELQGKKLVLIDTVGTSQRDQRVLEQIARLQDSPTPVRMVLVLNAAAQPETLDEVVASYASAARAAGGRLRDCMLTKHDETGRLAPVLDRVIRQGLRVLFVSHGQRVPEDLALVDGPALISQALRTPAREPAPFSAASSAGSASMPAWTQRLLFQGRRVALTLRALEEQLPGFRELLAGWELTSLPDQAQEEAAQEALQVLPAERGQQVSGVLWHRRTAAPGGDAPLPDLWLDGGGRFICWPSPQHRQPVGQTERLRWATARGGANVHLLPGLPEPGAWDWLMRQGFPWICQVRNSQRVYVDDNRIAMSDLHERVEPVDSARCSFRGQAAELKVGRVAVLAAPQARGRTPQRFAVRAWVGRIRSLETGAELGQRYWLTPRSLADNGFNLLQAQLAAEALPRLARRLEQKLVGVLPGHARPELRWQLANGLAVAATRLAEQQDEQGMDLRAELLGLLGVRTGATPARLGEAMLYLCSARDTLRILGGELDRGTVR